MKSSIKWIYFLLLILITIVFITSCEPKIEEPKIYKVGDIGPAGGYIFYVNDNYLNDGWKYLEAAPAGWYKSINKKWVTNNDPGIPFGFYWSSQSFGEVGTTDTAIGSGRTNTKALVTAMGDEAYTEEDITKEKSLYAAKVAYDYNGGGYTNWFLPSKDELDLMFKNLHKNGLGSFSDGFAYWCSCEYNKTLAHFQTFGNGDQNTNNRDTPYSVRPVRAF